MWLHQGIMKHVVPWDMSQDKIDNVDYDHAIDLFDEKIVKRDYLLRKYLEKKKFNFYVSVVVHWSTVDTR